MIVLRKISGSSTVSTSNLIIAGTLYGDTDGVNKVFTTEYDFRTDSIVINFNGQTLSSTHDFEITGNNEITLIHIAPTNEDVLNATYRTILADDICTETTIDGGTYT